MLDLPKQRYVRRNVKTILDYVSTYFPLKISTLSMHSGSCPFGVIAIGESESLMTGNGSFMLVPVCRYFMKKVTRNFDYVIHLFGIFEMISFSTTSFRIFHLSIVSGESTFFSSKFWIWARHEKNES